VDWVIFGHAGDDRLTNEGTVGSDINGGTGNDTLENTGTVRDLYGAAGADVIVNEGVVVVDIHAGTGSDTVQLLNNAVINGIIDGGEDSNGSDYDRLEFRFTVSEDEYEELAAQIANASPSGGSISFGGQTYRWRNFEELVNLLQIAQAMQAADVTVTLSDGRLNVNDVAAPVAIYYSDGSLSVYDIGMNGGGTLAVSVDPQTLSIGQAAAGMGNTVTRLDEQTLRISAPDASGATYTFDMDAAVLGE
jgi:hypothetical protein